MTPDELNLITKIVTGTVTAEDFYAVHIDFDGITDFLRSNLGIFNGFGLSVSVTFPNLFSFRRGGH